MFLVLNQMVDPDGIAPKGCEMLRFTCFTVKTQSAFVYSKHLTFNLMDLTTTCFHGYLFFE